MIDIDTNIQQIRRNCDISDAAHAGLFSICGLALRLRDLYKWEHNLPPWVEKDSSEILDWIGKKEQLWEQIAANDYERITLSGNQYDPFDTETINAVLANSNLFYGAGYARSLKPTFFLAEIKEKRDINGHTIYILSRELARDLLTLPAMTQDGKIILREESARFYLWDQLIYINQSGRPALHFALSCAGLHDFGPENLKQHLEILFEKQKNIFIRHEIGELNDTVFDTTLWREIIASFPHSPIELFARAVKDLLADTHPDGTLCALIAEQNEIGIGFYAAFQTGFLKTVFPEIQAVFPEFARTRQWRLILQANESGRQTAIRYAQEMITIFQQGKQSRGLKWAGDQILKKLINPLIQKN